MIKYQSASSLGLWLYLIILVSAFRNPLIMVVKLINYVQLAEDKIWTLFHKTVIVIAIVIIFY